MTLDRTKRVKDARNEAQKEIEDYRKQKDDEFKKFEKEVRPPGPLVPRPSPHAAICLVTKESIREQQTSGNQKAEEDASKDADEQLKGIKAAGEKMGDKVVEDLLRVVVEVKPEVPDRVVAPTKG